MRRTTIKDVAALAGVSPATVSRTLDDRPEISAETKERVRAACAQLGYVPNAAAKGLTGQATHTLGVVVPDVSNPYFTGIATAIEETAAENGYRVLLSNSLQEEGRELRAIENFLARQIDGVLISPLSRESQAKHADLLEGFGGHELAAGFTISEENIDAFRARMNRYVRSASGGLTIALELFGETFISWGYTPEIIHRVASIACGGLDTLPWNGTVVMLFALSGVSYKKGYKHVAMETVILPLLSLIPVFIYYSIVH